MGWIKKIFKPKKSNNEIQLSKEEEMLAKLEASINNCLEETKKAGNEKDQLRKWAIEAIQETFEVPNRFWYEELKMYQEIRGIEENKSVDKQVVAKCDEIVQGYLDEIAIRDAKIKLYNDLVEKYQASKEKMLLIRKRKESETLANSKLHALDKHSMRLEQMKENPDNLPSHIEDTNKLDLLKGEVNEVYEEFKINEEVRSYVQDINKQFKTGATTFSSKDVVDEIEGLLKKLKKDDGIGE